MVPILPVKGEVTTKSTHELGAVPKARAETRGRCRLGLGCWLCAHTHLRYPASPQLGGGSVAHCSLRLHHQVPSQEGDKSGVMTPWVREMTACPEDLKSTASTYMAAANQL